MLVYRQITSLAVLVIAAGGVCSAEDTQDYKHQLNGKWLVKTSVIDGEKTPDTRLRTPIVIEDDTWGTETSKIRFTFTVNNKADPKQLTLKLTTDGGVQEWPGIYKLTDDTLTFCRQIQPGGDRPSQFKGAKGVSLEIYKRLNE